MTLSLAILNVGVLVGIFLLVPQTLCEDTEKSKISPDLKNLFHSDRDARTNVVIKFNGNPAEVLEKFSVTGRSSDVDINELHKTYISELKQLRDLKQAKVLEFLDKPSVLDSNMQHSSCWMTNEIFVKKANKALVKQLAKFEDVESIQKEQIFSIHKPLEEGPVVDQSRIVEDQVGSKAVKSTGTEWNILKIKAEEAQAASGSKGEGIMVGIIDTGMNPTHEAFRSNQIAKFKDAVNGKTEAYDDNGHGTHCAGTIGGNTGTGVAPGVTFICCKACGGDGSCAQSDLTSCGEFMHEEKPHIVSNSWGGPSESPWYDHIINSWVNAGMLPVFSAGNSGPACNTVGSPGDNAKVISVASTNKDDALSDFSSRGKCAGGVKCPSLSAPGEKIMSCWSSSNTAYKSISGTSMAAPHVSGALAVLMGNNKMTATQAKNAITISCVHSGLADPHQSCGGSTFEKFHNNMYGNGRIDCMKALESLNSDAKENSGKESEGKEIDKKENGQNENAGKENGVTQNVKKGNSSSKKNKVKHVKVVFTTNV